MKVNGPNSPPTASASTVSTEDNKTLTFTVADFGFSDADTGDSLEGVKITSVPAQGTLSLEGTDIASASDANPVGVTAKQLTDGDLKYNPPIDTTVSVTFDFKVFDGAADSASAAEMSINVTDVKDNAKLSALSISAGTLNFDADTLNYTVTVANDVTGVTVTPTADDNDATVTVNGTDVASGSASREISLTEGEDTVIQVVVTAEGGTPTGTYTITVSRAANASSRFGRLNAEILSKHALTVADVTNRAIGARMDDPCGKPSTAYSLAGGSTLHDMLRSNAQVIEGGTLTLDNVLAGSSFRLPLAAASGGKTEGAGGPVVWGQGGRQALESTESALAWDGTVLTGQLGIDGCLRKDILTGFALSRSVGEFDYTDATGPVPVRGDYASRMTSVHPYLGWTSPQGFGLWATVGYGWGDIEIEDAQVRDGDPDYPVRRSDTTLKTAAAAGRGPLITEDSPIAGGTMALTVRSEASLAQVEVEGDDGLIEEQTVNAWRLRLSLEGSHEQALASGSSLTPSLELGTAP